MSKRIWVYVSGPYTKGDVGTNVANAIAIGNSLWNVGYFPYVPHFTHFWNMLHPKGYEEWMKVDFQALERCDVLLRIPGESSGADREVEYFRDLGRPIYYDFLTLCKNEYNEYKEPILKCQVNIGC